MSIGSMRPAMIQCMLRSPGSFNRAARRAYASRFGQSILTPIASIGPTRYRSTETKRGKLAFAFDIDGVLKQGEHVLPEAKRVLSMLSQKSSPIPFLLITNGGGMTEIDRVKALSRNFGVQLSPNQLVQSHTPLRDYVSEYRDKPVLVCGGKGDAGSKIAHSYGLNEVYLLQDMVAWKQSLWDRYILSEEEQAFVNRGIDFSQIPISAIFVIHDAGLDWALATHVILELLLSEQGRMSTQRKREFGKRDGKDIPLVLTNPDVLWGSDYPVPRFGMGAFRIGLNAVYKNLTGCDMNFVQLGKPYPATYDFAEAMLRRHLVEMGQDGQEPLNVYMVGDNPESDIAGANAKGWESILVKTGVYRDGQPAHTPSVIVDNVEQGVQWAMEREGVSG